MGGLLQSVPPTEAAAVKYVGMTGFYFAGKFEAVLPIILTTLGFTFLGESLRDIFDPKLRKDF